MSVFLGLDLGTTTLAAAFLDVDAGRTLASVTAQTTALRAPAVGGPNERAELDVAALCEDALRLLTRLVEREPELARRAGGIGVAGQQHGVALLNARTGEPLGPAITWQDRRVLDRIPGRGETYLERFMSLAGGEAAFRRTGCLPAAGYLGPTLFWLAAQEALPGPEARACFVPDAVAAFLTGRPPVTDPTNGGSSGIFDVVARDWHRELARRVGIPAEILPPAQEPGTPLGGLRADLAARVGLTAGLGVGVAMGDNQASFLGSVADPANTILLNVGTGAQVSAWVRDFARMSELDTRAFPDGGYLLVGAGLFGGRSYAHLAELFRQVGTAFFGAAPGAEGDADLYDRMNELASRVPPGSDGLACSPLFTGSRADPDARGSFSGLTPRNLTPGHLARALLEGMAEGFYGFHERMAPAVGDRHTLVGSGNGIRRNPLLARILATRFAMPVAIPEGEEASAAGAALIAAVGAGAVADVQTAMGRIRYLEVVAPEASERT